MITQSESGLSAADYAALAAATGDLAVDIDLERYGPVWTQHPDTHAASWSGRNFDVVAVGSYLVKAYNPNVSNVSTISDISAFYLADESGGDQSWTAIPGVPGDIDADVPLSLASDGTAVYLFYYSLFDNKIKRTRATPLGTFEAPEDVGAVANVRYIMATSLNKVHYITRTTTKMNWRLHYYEKSAGVWTSTSSDVYWQYPIYAADAVEMDTCDLIVLATEMPPYMSSRAVGTTVTTEANRVQALVTFREKDGRWSDHDQIDTIDIVDKDRSRDNVRVSLHGGYYFAAYLRCGGQDAYTYSEAFVSRSRDGESWEFPERITASFTTPCVILPRADDYLYAVGLNYTQRSPRCAWAGQTAISLDVTKYVIGMESTAADIRNTSLELSNPADVLDGTLAKSTARIQAIYKLGYQSGADNLICQVSTEDVLGWRDQHAMPHQGLALHAQDRMGRVNRIRSDYAAEWPGHQAGRDAYNDPTGTGYGGLRYTAPYQGSWKAYDGELHLIASENEGIAVSTLVTDALNGSAQTGFYLDTASKGEYAGVSWHVYDKDNLFFAAFYLDDDVIRLTRRTGGHDEVLATSGAMSWAVDTWYWIKVIVHYGMVYVYTSTDGITFAGPLAWASGNGEMYAQPDWAGETALAWTGKFGAIGYGYSDQDTWDDWDYDPWPGPITEPEHYGMVVISEAELARSFNFFELTETCAWEDIKGAITGDLCHIAIGGNRQAWVTSSDGLWYTGNIAAATVSWSCAKTDAAGTTETGLAGRFIAVDVTPGGIVYAPWHGGYAVGRGYYSGTAGSVAHSVFPLYNLASPHCNAARCGFAVYCGDGIPRIACGAGGTERALMWANDAYTRFANALDGQIATCIRRDGYITTWDGELYSGYDPNSLVLSMGTPPEFGFDTFGSTVLYYTNAPHDVYRDGVLLATAATVWGAGEAFGRVGFVRNNVDEIVGVIQGGALAGGEPGKFIVYTTDAFINYHDRTGDFKTAVDDWSGDTAAEDWGNASFATFPYNDDDYP